MIYDCNLKVTNIRYDDEHGLMAHVTDGKEYYEICVPVGLDISIKVTSTEDNIYRAGRCIQNRLPSTQNIEVKFTNKQPIYDKALIITELPPVELTIKDLEREKHRKVKIISE